MTDKSGLRGNVDGHDGTDEWRYGENEWPNIRVAKDGLYVAEHYVEWAFGRSRSSEWRLEDKCNWINIYSHIVPSTTSFTSLLLLSMALNSIPALGFIILFFSSWIIQIYLAAKILSCNPSWDGPNIHALVIQYHCQCHSEDSYKQASMQVMKVWLTNMQRWTETRHRISVHTLLCWRKHANPILTINSPTFLCGLWHLEPCPKKKVLNCAVGRCL